MTATDGISYLGWTLRSRYLLSGGKCDDLYGRCFSLQTNLSSFTGNSYRNISRTYVEFQNFHSQITYANPQTIVPALPLAQTSAPTDEEGVLKSPDLMRSLTLLFQDDRIIKIMLQCWLTRICEDPVILKDDELRSFIESEFGVHTRILFHLTTHPTH